MTNIPSLTPLLQVVVAAGVVSAAVSQLPPLPLHHLPMAAQSFSYWVSGLLTPDEQMPALLLVCHSSAVLVGSVDREHNSSNLAPGDRMLV